MSSESTSTRLQEWFTERGITEVECLVPDITGEAKGKIVPAGRYLGGERPRLPDSIFIQTVTGDYPDDEGELIDPAERDMQLVPDPDTCALVPWAHEPTAQIVHDCRYLNDEPVTVNPRYVLGRVLELYAEMGLKPVVAPEMEFYLVQRNTDADCRLPPTTTGRALWTPGEQQTRL